jgi:RNase P subunit RPR2
MRCEQCHALMIERPPIRQKKDADKEQAIVVLECTQCGHTEYQPLIASFWRRLAA